MDSDLKIDVASLDELHRRALEEVLGQELAANQQLIIHVAETKDAPSDRPVQSLDDWTKVFDGLSDADKSAIDEIARDADLTRHLP